MCEFFFFIIFFYYSTIYLGPLCIWLVFLKHNIALRPTGRRPTVIRWVDKRRYCAHSYPQHQLKITYRRVILYRYITSFKWLTNGGHFFSKYSLINTKLLKSCGYKCKVVGFTNDPVIRASDLTARSVSIPACTVCRRTPTSWQGPRRVERSPTGLARGTAHLHTNKQKWKGSK